MPINTYLHNVGILSVVFFHVNKIVGAQACTIAVTIDSKQHPKDLDRKSAKESNKISSL